VTRRPWQRAIRRHLIAGLVVIAPVTATVAVLFWIFQALDGLLGRFLYPAIGAAVGRERIVIPGLGLLVLFLLLLFTGWAAERAIGSRMLVWWNDILERLPLTRRIYGAANRIVRTVFGEGTRPFKTVVAVEYPAAGRWSIGFLAGDAPDAVDRVVGESLTVFIPTTPNPTSGFLAIVPPAAVRPLAMSVDEAFTFILSAGSVRPDEEGNVVLLPPEALAASPEPR